jgi:hypothetical protein
MRSSCRAGSARSRRPVGRFFLTGFESGSRPELNLESLDHFSPLELALRSADVFASPLSVSGCPKEECILYLGGVVGTVRRSGNSTARRKSPVFP